MYRKRLILYLPVSQNLLWFGQLWKTMFCPQNDFFSGTFKKTKYIGSQNWSNHLSEVAVEKKALWFSICFLKIRNFLSRPFDFNWDSLWFYLAQLGREIRFGSLEIMKYEKLALRSTMKGEGKQGKTIGGKSMYFYDWMQLRRQNFSIIFCYLSCRPENNRQE